MAGDKMEITKKFSVQFSVTAPLGSPTSREWATVACADASQIHGTLYAVLKSKGDIQAWQYLTIHQAIAED